MIKKLDNLVDFLVLFVVPLGVISAMAIMAGVGVVIAILSWLSGTL